MAWMGTEHLVIGGQRVHTKGIGLEQSTRTHYANHQGNGLA